MTRRRFFAAPLALVAGGAALLLAPRRQEKPILRVMGGAHIEGDLTVSGEIIQNTSGGKDAKVDLSGGSFGPNHITNTYIRVNR